MKKFNIISFIFIIILLAFENFLYLVPYNSYLINNILKISDIGVLSSIVFFVFVMFMTKQKNKTRYSYDCFIYSFLAITIFSSISAYMFFGQPISVGLRSLRNQLTSFILYFPLVKMIKNDIVSKEKAYRIIYIIVLLEIIVYFLQYFLINKYTFTYIDLSEIRFEKSRLRFAFLLPLIVGLFSLDKLLNKSNNKIKHTFFFVFGVSVLCLLCQYRAPTVMLFLSLIMIFILWKKKAVNKLFWGIIIGCLGVFIISNSSVFQSIVNIYNGTNLNTSSNSLEIRSKGQSYYLEKIKKSPIFGFGFPNTNYLNAVAASGQQYYYYLSDNGIFGFLYINGFLGVIWLVVLYLKLLKDSYLLYKKKRNYSYLAYYLFEIGNAYIGLHWYWLYPLPFILMMVLLECELNEKEERYNEKSRSINCNL